MTKPSNDPYTQSLAAAMFSLLKQDSSWCDDFGEDTLSETARRVSNICAQVATNRFYGIEKLHHKSFGPASRGQHRDRYYCVACTVYIDDYIAYVDWPCPTIQSLIDDLQELGERN